MHTVPARKLAERPEFDHMGVVFRPRPWRGVPRERMAEAVRLNQRYPNMEKLRQRLSDKIDRVRQCLNLGKTGESSEGCAREDHQFAA
jgi:hypothetical protein